MLLQRAYRPPLFLISFTMNQNPCIGKAVARFWPCPPLLAPSCWVPMWTLCLFLELAKPSTLCSALARGVLSEWNLSCQIWFLLVIQGSAQLLLFLRWPSLASLPKTEPARTPPKTPPSLSSPTHCPLIACLCLFLWNSSVSEITFYCIWLLFPSPLEFKPQEEDCVTCSPRTVPSIVQIPKNYSLNEQRVFCWCAGDQIRIFYLWKYWKLS